MIRLKHKSDGSIPVGEMKDGQVAEIAAWTTTNHIGKIIQRHGTHLVKLGAVYNEGWDAFFPAEDVPGCRVRILEPGTELVIE